MHATRESAFAPLLAAYCLAVVATVRHADLSSMDFPGRRLKKCRFEKEPRTYLLVPATFRSLARSSLSSRPAQRIWHRRLIFPSRVRIPTIGTTDSDGMSWRFSRRSWEFLPLRRRQPVAAAADVAFRLANPVSH
jgi:hypothetical protein